MPVTDKKRLIARFDDWVTDREATIDKARSFAETPELIGERFLGKYTLSTTSGTTGTPGIFVLDDRTMAVVGAMALRTMQGWLGFGDLTRILAGGAADGHDICAWQPLRHGRACSARLQVRVMAQEGPDALGARASVRDG